MRSLTAIHLRAIGALTGLLLASLVLWLAPRPLIDAEQRLADRLGRQFPAKQAKQIAIVEIDNAALAAHGLWPWPRPQTAQLVKALASADPAAVFVDAVFQNPREGDQELADAFAMLGRKNILGLPVEYDGADPALKLEGVNDLGAFLQPHLLPTATRGLVPLPLFREQAGPLGLMSLDRQQAGAAVRHLPCAARVADGVVFCVALELAAVAKGSDAKELAQHLDRAGRLHLRYPGKWSESFLPHYSAQTILAATATTQGQADLRQALGGKVVLVGVTADAYGDLQQTPDEQAVPGLWLHAVAANQFVVGAYVAALPRAVAVLALTALLLAGYWLSRRDQQSSWTVTFVLFTLAAGIFTWFSYAGRGLLFPLPAFMFGLGLQAIGVLVASAFVWQLDRNKTERELIQQTQIDPLTNVANRRQFEDTLRSEWQRHRRSGSPMAVAMLDVDHFKLYNDTYGHRAGDRCLQAVAAALNDAAKRSGELVTRYGGEEFAVILPETDLQQALVFAQTLVRDVEALQTPHSASPTAPVVTISVGVAAVVPDDNTGAMLLVEEADKALYAAKRSGRNRAAAGGQT